MSILRADSIRDRAGTGAPDFPNGATVTGVVTATSFSGSLTGNVSGTSAGLTGTPNISVGTVGCGNVTSSGDVTGVNATFSGNLTVQGTTTTIDTAVTSVDSLAVDGQVTAGTRVGIGSTTPTDTLDLVASAPRIRAVAENGNSGLRINVEGGGNEVFRLQEDNNTRLEIAPGGTAIFKAGLAEKFQTGTTIQADPTIALSDGNIVLRTSNESGNQAINFTGVHSTLAVGEAVSFTVIITPNGSGAINNVQIDAATQTIQWSGGSAPSAGAVGSRDVYTFTLLKTGSGTTDYQVFGAATNYA